MLASFPLARPEVAAAFPVVLDKGRHFLRRHPAVSKEPAGSARGAPEDLRAVAAENVRLQMVWENLSCLGTEALARLG